MSAPEHDFAVGRFAVVMGSYGGMLSPEIIQIVEITAKQIRSRRFGTRLSHTSKDDVLAVFDTREEAEALVSKIAGIRGERDRRIQAAGEYAREAARAAISLAGEGA